MRKLLFVSLLTLTTAACHRTAEQRRAAALRGEAKEQALTLEKQAKNTAGSLERQARALRETGKATGGYTGKRLSARADDLSQQAKLVRKQAHLKAEAITEEADARVKAAESR